LPSPSCWPRGGRKKDTSDAHKTSPTKAIETVQNKAPQVVKIENEDVKPSQQQKPQTNEGGVATPAKQKRPQNVKRLAKSEQEIFEAILHSDLDFASDPWPGISESAKDLVKKMLVRDPSKRLSAFDVLRHPWIQVDGAAPDKPLDSAVLSRMKQFTAMNKLKKMALRVSYIFCHITHYNIFLRLLGLSHCKCLCCSSYINLTHHSNRFGFQADVDNSGTIDYGEFIAATLHLNKVDREDHLVAAFSYFDKDGSGYITRDELQKACEEFGLGEVGLEEMIREADQNNDGRIDYNEFVAMMQRGNAEIGKRGRKGSRSLSIAFREALPVC
ncbi:hypothetical protein RYX36_018406, partial [Vicia faba]